LTDGAIKELTPLIGKIQPEIMVLQGWTPYIKYNDDIRNKLILNLRNALKLNNIKVLNMNMEEEDYYEKQLAYFIFKRLLNYYENTNNEFEIVPMEKTFCAFKVSEDIIKSYLVNMESFHNNFLKLNDEYSIPIDTKNESEIIVLNEKFEKVMLDVIDNMNFDSLVETINNHYQQIKSSLDDETQKLRNTIQN
jgi:hypothetical protein